MMPKITLYFFLLLLGIKGYAQNISPGADQMEEYLPLLKGKKVGVFANHTSVTGGLHLVDAIKAQGINITVIFGPEHGFRGTADAGEKVANYMDKKTGIQVISLYGGKQKPSREDLKNVDILLFDIQDVGVRFYTYISSLEKYLEAALENDKPLIILDRPNPNGFYVDGPVLEKKYTSFVGMQSVPIVYGMTIGEYALMIAGEGWLSKEANARYKRYKLQDKQSENSFYLKVIKNKGYDHTSKYTLPVKPSPNLPNIQSVYLYPSTCLFEGTTLSEGRGTDKPFQVFGSPLLPDSLYSFTPIPNEGAKNSKHFNKKCYGWDLSGEVEKVLSETNARIQLKWIMEAYRLFPQKDSFFIVPESGKMEQSFFNKLAGNNELWQQIRAGKSEDEIRAGWQPGLKKFKTIRKKYLLYKDF